MGEKLNWRKAVTVSAVLHLMAFTCLGGLVKAEIPLQEEILEMALIDDLSLYGQAGSAAPQGDGSPVLENITPPQPEPPQNQRTEIKQPEKPTEKTLTETKPVNENMPAETVAAAPITPPAGGSSLPGNSSGGAASGISGGSGSGTGNSGGSGSGTGGGISPPAVLASVKPPYPPQARQKGIEGIVVLQVLVLENGRVGDASVVSSSGDSSLDAAALTSVHKWRFVPAQNLATGEKLRSYARTSVSFELE
ncbi:MAG: TonB family protein [Sporomusaceae bacterium]|jgi:protein TonB|nr:TonB family protein [Sporomusaceae bacterium]